MWVAGANTSAGAALAIAIDCLVPSSNHRRSFISLDVAARSVAGPGSPAADRLLGCVVGPFIRPEHEASVLANLIIKPSSSSANAFGEPGQALPEWVHGE